jgi:hypothetical protein
MTANERTMREIAVHPGVADSIHTRDVRRPMVDDVAEGRGVSEARFAGWLERLLTTPVHDLEDPRAVLTALEDRDTIKAYVEIATAAAPAAS